MVQILVIIVLIAFTINLVVDSWLKIFKEIRNRNYLDYLTRKRPDGQKTNQRRR